MSDKTLTPSAVHTAPVLWLVTDETSKPYEHHVGEDACDCKSCVSKKSKLILN